MGIFQKVSFKWNVSDLKRSVKTMTVQEAIEIITNAVQNDNMTAEQDKALAIVQKAAEKQMPKLAVFEADGYDDEGKLIYDIAYCPNCKEAVLSTYNYCPYCGAKRI